MIPGPFFWLWGAGPASVAEFDYVVSFRAASPTATWRDGNPDTTFRDGSPETTWRDGSPVTTYRTAGEN